jgi:hypothetical protein
MAAPVEAVAFGAVEPRAANSLAGLFARRRVALHAIVAIRNQYVAG